MKDRINKKELMAFLALVTPSNAFEANTALMKALVLYNMNDITCVLLQDMTRELCRPLPGKAK